MASLSDSLLVSIIVCNYNGIKFVENCLKSIFSADYQNFEVIFVDNASSDGSLDLVKQEFGLNQRLKIIVNKIGLGPAKGRNIGIQNAGGKYIAFLDNDTEVEPSWLTELVKVLEKDPTIAAAQSKLLLSDRKTIDSCGHYLSICGFPYEIGVGEKDHGQYNEMKEIFGAKSAALFIRRDVFEKTGYFDEDYFIHSEETDLCWRIWLNNYRIVCIPSSIVYHKRGGSLNEHSRNMMFYEGSKNCTKTLIKNLEFKNLLVILPLHILGWFAVAISLLLRKRLADAKAIVCGLSWDLVNIKCVIRDRLNVQNKRVVEDKKIMPIIMGSYDTLTLIKKGIGWICRT